jgi:hypothetical protein
MAVSMYHASVPVFLQLLGGLKGTLDKAQKHATEKKWDEATVFNLRLYPDMFTLARQVRQASEHAFGAGRAAGVEVPQLPAIDNSWAEMQSRLDKTIDFLKGLRPDQLDGKEDSQVTITVGGQPRTFRAQVYLSLRDAEFLFSYDDGVRHPAQPRRRDWQARLHGCDAYLSIASSGSGRRRRRPTPSPRAPAHGGR